VRFQYEWHDDAGQWHRSYGNEQWEFDEHGLMRRREASINDVMIAEKDRRFRWTAPGPRPADGWRRARSDVTFQDGQPLGFTDVFLFANAQGGPQDEDHCFDGAGGGPI
jgi:hypothetical protein